MAAAAAEKTKPDTNPRGIPRAPFVADVEEHLGGPNAEVENTLRQFDEAMAKYRYMEHNLLQRRKVLEDKIPDIKRTLGVVEFLKGRRDRKRRTARKMTSTNRKTQN